jgi:hypothetical protein
MQIQLIFLYTDQIQFDSGANQQNIELVTLIKMQFSFIHSALLTEQRNATYWRTKKLKVLFG